MIGFGSVKSIVGAVILTAFIAVVGFGYWQYKRANEAEAALSASNVARQSDLNSFKLAKQQMETSIKMLEDRRAKDQERMDAISKANNRIVEERDAHKAKLDSFRDRIAKVAKAKPDRLGRLATRSSERLFSAIAEASGADTNRNKDGGNKKIPPASP